MKDFNKRSAGIARTRTERVVQTDDLQVLGLRGWRRRDGDGEEWRRLLREARA